MKPADLDRFPDPPAPEHVLVSLDALSAAWHVAEEPLLAALQRVVDAGLRPEGVLLADLLRKARDAHAERLAGSRHDPGEDNRNGAGQRASVSAIRQPSPRACGHVHADRDEFIPVPCAAVQLGVSERTVCRLAKDGALDVPGGQAAERRGRPWWIPAEAVAARRTHTHRVA